MNLGLKKTHSNGKLLLSGEYLVMYGAKALAFPTKYGQNMCVEPHSESNVLRWKAYSLGEMWFSAHFHLPTLEIIKTSSMDKAVFLQNILKKAKSFNKSLLTSDQGLEIRTEADFDRNWGLGTSSTLISNIAQMADIDPFKLSFSVTQGSGYDIACAASSSPIVFRKTPSGEVEYSTVSFDKPYLENLYFVYSGHKKSTQNEVDDFLRRHKGMKSEIQTINSLTAGILETDDFNVFKDLLIEHERLVGGLLNQTPIQEASFCSFDGVIKSLGAWGGDFLLAATTRDSDYVSEYFEHFGLTSIIPFIKMIRT